MSTKKPAITKTPDLGKIETARDRLSSIMNSVASLQSLMDSSDAAVSQSVSDCLEMQHQQLQYIEKLLNEVLGETEGVA